MVGFLCPHFIPVKKSQHGSSRDRGKNFISHSEINFKRKEKTTNLNLGIITSGREEGFPGKWKG